jgi:hypothetical protein
VSKWSFSLRCAVPGGGLAAAVESDKLHALDPSQPSPAIERIASVLARAGLTRVRVDHSVEPGTLIVQGIATGDTEEEVRRSIERLAVDAVETEFVGAVVHEMWLSRDADSY